MTELEKLQQAKRYIDELASGIDPISGSEAPESDIINNVQLSRCFFYVSDILRQLIENGGVAARGNKASTLQPFNITHETLKAYDFSDEPITVSRIAERINALIDSDNMHRLKASSIMAFLMQSQILVWVETAEGRSRRPTPVGESLGIHTQLRTGQRGEYTAVTYDRSAQQFILDNIDGIIQLDNSTEQLPENHGKPWLYEADARLTKLFANGADTKTLSSEFKRTRHAISSRLKKLGLR